MKSIVYVLMERDGMSEDDAKQLVDDARRDLYSMLENEEDIDEADFCADWFGLEPDYIIELL